MPGGMSRGPRWFPIAIQALVAIAESDGPCSSNNMAQELKAHPVFLRQMLAKLVRANLIRAREGRDGGYQLACPREKITLAQVYHAVSTPDPTELPVKTTNDLSERVLDFLEEIGDETEKQLLAILERYTLDTVIARIAPH